MDINSDALGIRIGPTRLTGGSIDTLEISCTGVSGIQGFNSKTTVCGELRKELTVAEATGTSGGVAEVAGAGIFDTERV